jgi:rhomboid protease GluP
MNRSEAHLRLTRDHKLAQEWELVLLADGLSPRVHRIQDGIVITVPEEEWERAGASLAAYDRENPPKHAERREPVRPTTLLTGIVVAAMLLAFFYTTVVWKPTLPWFERGGADAGGILDGELWRTVTALTLHVDLVHVMSNAVGIAIFLGAVSSLLGPGISCALVLLAGAGGNFVNALVQGSPHLSIGASTSVFGAVGILGGLGMARRRRQTMRRRRAWMPIVAALALLGLLGTEGQRVDIWAHFFGFVSGGFLGIIYDFAAPRRLGHPAQWVSGATALAVLIGCWIIALG